MTEKRHIQTHISYEEALEEAVGHLKMTMNKMPNPPMEYAECADGYYFDHTPVLDFMHIGTWMTSFFTGEALLAYHYTGKGKYLEWVGGYYDAYKSKITEHAMDTMHDIGFLYTLFSTGYYRETGDARYAALSVRAADELAKRMNLDHGLIRAWGRCDTWDHHSAGLAIIDCMMNLPLLFFAAVKSGNPFYRQIAVLHADHTMKTFIRADGSVCHGYQYMEAGGTAAGEANHCGYADGSFWARGLTWAIYGFALAYRHTKEERYLDLSVTLAERYVSETRRSSADLVPPWDFRLPAGESANKDSSAAAIAACAFHELGRYPKGKQFLAIGEEILSTLLADAYRNPDPQSSGLLLHSNGREVCTSFGDYFYMEALLRYLDGFRGYW